LKKAIGIVNRNMPDLTDELVEGLSSIDADIFVLENGSDKDRYSKYANLFEEESNGLAYGVNKILSHCMDHGYEYVWMNYNDARCENPEEFFEWSISSMQEDSKIGVCTPVWGSMWNFQGQKVNNSFWNNDGSLKNQLVTFFDDLTYVVSRRALEAISSHNQRLTPFFDSTNFSNHYSLAASSLSLYSSGMYMMTNSSFRADEIKEEAENNSVQARGYDDKYWKEVKGPADVDKWINSYFPEFKKLNISNKQKRDIIISRISKIATEGFLSD
jgi:hypothetical protein